MWGVTIKVEIEGHDVEVRWLLNGQVEARSEALPGKKYGTPDEIEKDLKAYNLGLRKDFSNPVAYRDYGSDVQEVTVTSVCEGGKDAWVRAGGQRMKLSVSGLFVDRVAVEDYMTFRDANRFAEQQRYKALECWSPKKEQP